MGKKKEKPINLNELEEEEKNKKEQEEDKKYNEFVA